jgi:hypothetical protein
MLEALSLSFLIFACTRRGSKLGTVFSMLGLVICIYALRWTNGEAIPMVIGTIAVFLFWFAQSIRISLSSVQTLIVLTLGLGFALFLFQDTFPFFSNQAITGYGKNFDFTPASIASMKSSHEKALELYFDHPPNADERYFKTGTLGVTTDGLEYKIGTRAPLTPEKFPETARYAKTQLPDGDLQADLKVLKTSWTSSFRYSLEPGEMKGEHPLDTFLFDRKVGFCEHYAAALSTILKLKGYTTHVAIGFSGGAWNPVFHKLTYEMADAHAWVEVFNAKDGHWERIDPTLWVSPTENEPRVDHTLLKWALGFIIVSLLFLAFFSNRSRDPVQALLKELARIEKKLKLNAGTLTVTERLSRLSGHLPERAAFLSKLTDQYQTRYFEPQQRTSETRFLASLRFLKWIRFRSPRA